MFFTNCEGCVGALITGYKARRLTVEDAVCKNRSLDTVLCGDRWLVRRSIPNKQHESEFCSVSELGWKSIFCNKQLYSI